MAMCYEFKQYKLHNSISPAFCHETKKNVFKIQATLSARLRIGWLYFLWRGLSPFKKGCPGYVTKLHLMVRLLFWGMCSHLFISITPSYTLTEPLDIKYPKIGWHAIKINQSIMSIYDNHA